MGRRFVIADIHGAYKGLKECLEGVNFDYENDTLIQLGDIVDGWSEIKETLDELMKIKNLVYIVGNHDLWAIEYYNGYMNDREKQHWIHHRGDTTLDSLGEKGEIDSKYLDFLESGVNYHLEDDMVFAHGSMVNGSRKDYDSGVFLSNSYTRDFAWKRQYMFSSMCTKSFNDNRFSKVFLGHTPSINFNNDKYNEYIISNNLTKIKDIKYAEYMFSKPVVHGNLYAMDTNAAFTGGVCITNIDTDEYFISQPSYMLYPDEMGRNDFKYKQLNRMNYLTTKDG